MSDMDSKQDGFFDHSRKLAQAIDSANSVRSALACIERNGDVIRNLNVNGETFDVICLAEPDSFIVMLHAMMDAMERTRNELSDFLIQYVRAGARSGVVDNEFAEEFIGKINARNARANEA
jgi:hypothetical protein